MQVIQELRTGVQLKKVQAGGPCLRNPTIEYELTPYEILMDDIRARRYKLNKVSSTFYKMRFDETSDVRFVVIYFFAKSAFFKNIFLKIK
jgi:hypothetical protein